jgi:hypothetical protein
MPPGAPRGPSQNRPTDRDTNKDGPKREETGEQKNLLTRVSLSCLHSTREKIPSVPPSPRVAPNIAANRSCCACGCTLHPTDCVHHTQLTRRLNPDRRFLGGGRPITSPWACWVGPGMPLIWPNTYNGGTLRWVLAHAGWYPTPLPFIRTVQPAGHVHQPGRWTGST